MTLGTAVVGVALCVEGEPVWSGTIDLTSSIPPPEVVSGTLGEDFLPKILHPGFCAVLTDRGLDERDESESGSPSFDRTFHSFSSWLMDIPPPPADRLFAWARSELLALTGVFATASEQRAYV